MILIITVLFSNPCWHLYTMRNTTLLVCRYCRKNLALARFVWLFILFLNSNTYLFFWFFWVPLVGAWAPGVDSFPPNLSRPTQGTSRSETRHRLLTITRTVPETFGGPGVRYYSFRGKFNVWYLSNPHACISKACSSAMHTTAESVRQHSTHARTHRRAHTTEHTHACARTHTYTNVCEDTQACIHAYTHHTHIQTHTHMHMQACIALIVLMGFANFPALLATLHHLSTVCFFSVMTLRSLYKMWLGNEKEKNAVFKLYRLRQHHPRERHRRRKPLKALHGCCPTRRPALPSAPHPPHCPRSSQARSVALPQLTSVFPLVPLLIMYQVSQALISLRCRKRSSSARTYWLKKYESIKQTAIMNKDSRIVSNGLMSFQNEQQFGQTQMAEVWYAIVIHQALVVFIYLLLYFSNVIHQALIPVSFVTSFPVHASSVYATCVLFLFFSRLSNKESGFLGFYLPNPLYQHACY